MECAEGGGSREHRVILGAEEYAHSPSVDAEGGRKCGKMNPISVPESPFFLTGTLRSVPGLGTAFCSLNSSLALFHPELERVPWAIWIISRMLSLIAS